MPLLAIPDLSERRIEAELMDAPALDRARHVAALDALRRVNAVSFATSRVWAEVARIARERAGPVRVLDVACGGGDILLGVARRARRAGANVELLGCDVSPVALEHARARAEGTARFLRLDVLREALPVGFDLVCSSLFLHHLAPAEARTLLADMAAVTERALVVQDLLRTRLGYVLAWAGLGVLTRSDVARHDGLASVAAALTLAEVGHLCDDAGLAGARIVPCWPQRFLIRWRRA